ncbi:XRE family transcriptional regulator [Gaetbulibacter jejuensis]|uniref:HTH cro/C1-type domain-containing protein n=1 Tax=Gaetbulibacter jejuensis TaxID=584607 RepID=A0ABN1JIM4_9FLAO
MNIGDKIRKLRIAKNLTQDDLAILTSFSKSYIQKFEENKREPNSFQLVKLASALNSSISEILSSTNFSARDYTFQNIEFREKHNIVDPESLKKTVIEDLYIEYSAYETLENILGEKVNFKNPVKDDEVIKSSNDIESLAIKLRKKWKFGNNPIYDLIGFLEDLGFKIFEVDKDEDFVGFSCWMKNTPVIVVNTRNKDIPRRRFTVLHELSHLLLKFDPNISKTELERYCDQFAGAMLLPQETLKQYLVSSSSISLEELKRIKEKFGISIRAILVRMVSVNFISWEKYHEWKELYYSWKNKDNTYYGTESVSRFDYLLARALREKKITEAKASELTRIPISTLKNDYLNKEFI